MLLSHRFGVYLWSFKDCFLVLFSECLTPLNSNLPIKETGYVQITSLENGGKKTIDVSFSKTYTAAPYIIIENSTAGGYFITAIEQSTTTGFKFGVYNPMSYALSGGVRFYIILL